MRVGRARRAAVALCLLALASCQRDGKLVGGPAPEFSLADLQGNAVRLANFRGRVVFLNVWATWCAPCREEMPSMESVSRQLQGPDFVMLAVSADEEGREVVDRFVREYRLTFPVLLDPELQIASRYKVTGYPETFLIDRNGRVVGHEIGPRDWASPAAVGALETLIRTGEWRGVQ
jgi:peroxiredoxin